jgi:hypothetical protein
MSDGLASAGVLVDAWSVANGSVHFNNRSCAHAYRS